MTPRKTYTTPKGTELPLLNLKGKEYLQVQHRLVWMREDHPDWSISTSFISVTEKEAMARAEIRDASGRVLATAHKTETASGFPDYAEKSETGAVGRALAFVGYGTQFCADELDEGERIVDSPVPPKGKPALKAVEKPSDPGSYVVPLGKYKGLTLKNMDITHVTGDYDYWSNVNNPGNNVKAHIEALEKFLESTGHIQRPAASEGK